MNNLSRLLCCRVEEDQLLYVEGDFFPLLGAPNYRWMLFLNRGPYSVFSFHCDVIIYDNFLIGYRAYCTLL